MQIVWHGQSCFEITSARNKNGQISIVIDPFSEESGLRPPKIEADILLTSSGHFHNESKTVSGNYFLIDGPGEYEVQNVFIHGVPSGENTIYAIETEDLKICHMGGFNQKELTEEQIEKIGDCDILMLPVGGNDTISAKEAVKIMSQLEPKITIPMHYALPKLKVKLDSLDKFLKTIGVKSIEPVKKLTLKKKDLSSEEAKIVVFKP